MTLTERIAEEIKARWETEGNGAIITMKNGKRYSCWAQEDGHFLITDKVTIWDAETYSKRTSSLEDMAETIARLARK